MVTTAFWRSNAMVNTMDLEFGMGLYGEALAKMPKPRRDR